MRERFHFSFTPSLLPSEALEALFVQREDLAERIVELTSECALSDAKYHFLLIGPRGIGKTHLVSLVYHRVKAITEIRDNLVIAWLQEDSWGIASFLDLLVRILQSLIKESGSEHLLSHTEQLFELAPEQAEKAAGLLLKEFVGKRTLFLIVENLEELFEGLGDIGQKRLRAYLQENPFSIFLATSPSLFNGISLQTSPFYGFFSVHHLSEFDFDHALDFLVKIARYKNDKHLTAFLRTPHGRARVRAVHHLAGGNPRVYTIFAQFLTRISMERLVEPFMRAMDDLTPYYQARMKQLSLQQRKIIELLCDRRGAITVKEIAQRCFITHQTTSSQLKLLREMRYVKATTIGRESFYELNEPLMRISLEVKKHRGEPLRLFVEFLRCWYTRPELEGLLKLVPTEAKTEFQYIRLALDLSQQTSDDPRVISCRKDLKRYKDDGKFEKALKALDELVALEGATYNNLVERGNILTGLEKHEEALEEFNRALDLDKDQIVAWFGSGYNYMRLSQYDEAIKAYDKVIDLGLDIPSVWWLRGRCLQELGHHEQAVQFFKKVIEQDPTDKDGWVSLGESLYELNKYLESYDAFSKVVQLDNNNKRAQYYQISSLFMVARFEQAISLCGEFDPMLSEDSVYIGLKASLLTVLDRDGEALVYWQKVIDKGDQSLYVRLGKVGSLFALQHWDEAETVLNEALTFSLNAKVPQPVEVDQILEKLFNTKQDVEFWQKGITLLVSSYANHNVLPALAAGLVRNIDHILPPTVSDAIAELWRDQWKIVAGNYPEMAMALRLLDTAIMYRLKKDRRILMELPIEERKFIEEIIDEMGNKSGDSEERGKKGSGPRI